MSFPWKRTTIVGAAIALVAAAAPAASAATPDHRPAAAGWQGAWAAAQHHPLSDGGSGPGWFLDGFANQSVRQVVRVSTGGSRVRIRLSNRFGVEPLHVAGATIAKAGSGAELKPGTLHALTFGRRLSATIAPGRELTSDAAGLPVSALDSLSVTLYFTKPTGPATFHDLGLTTAYRASGDHRFDPSGTAFAGDTSNSRYYLAGIDVDGQRTARGTVVAFGDSITDGYGTATNTDNRYPDELAERLVSAGKRFGVVNEGINGNKLLGDSTCYGEKGVTRFHRDVVAQPGVRTAIVLLGTNDIGGGGYPDFGCGASAVVTDRQLINGFRALIRTAHAHGIKIIGATLPPMKGAAGYDTPRNQDVRAAVNQWIRTSGEYDAVVDVAAVLTDPATQALRAEYNSGDQLHPNDAGARAIAAAIDLATL
ncbi:SGNH/GDSL hydrolase family protein [Dactylosporangium sp. NPDC049525]|uniref:SGNH/GDSL hydrolase family protein n=1 Tax=Dactylosporangium sp. NPDC049525 TaxID=3154730 RepID=UPI003448C1AB